MKGTFACHGVRKGFMSTPVELGVELLVDIVTDLLVLLLALVVRVPEALPCSDRCQVGAALLVVPVTQPHQLHLINHPRHMSAYCALGLHIM